MTLSDKFIKIDGKEYYVMFNYWENRVDDSFDHEYGTKKCGHYEVSDIDILEVYLQTDGGDQLEINMMRIDPALKKAITDELLGMRI